LKNLPGIQPLVQELVKLRTESGRQPRTTAEEARVTGDIMLLRGLVSSMVSKTALRQIKNQTGGVRQ
jgi:hypothetical protein